VAISGKLGASSSWKPPPTAPGIMSSPKIIDAGSKSLGEPYNTMVMVAACLGLRVSEIIGLQWGDFNWENMTALIQRAVVQCRVGETKTETSSRPLPIDPDLAARLHELRERSKYRGAEDWVFANDAGRRLAGDNPALTI
jgi:integrase